MLIVLHPMHCIAHSKLSASHMMCHGAFCRLVSQLQPFAGMQHLDVAGGTGDIAFRVLQRMREAEADAGASTPQQQVQMHSFDAAAGLVVQGFWPTVYVQDPSWHCQIATCSRQECGATMHPSVLLHCLQGSVIVADINADMLAEGRSRAVTRGFGTHRLSLHHPLCSQ